MTGTARSRLEEYANALARPQVWRSSLMCFSFQRTSSHSLEDKWLRWLKLMRQVNVTSLGDDARETLTSAGLKRAKERSLEQHLRHRAPQTWVVLCADVDQYLRSTVDSSTARPTPMESVLSCQRVPVAVKVHMKSRSADCAMQSAAIAAKLDISRRCAGNVRNQWSSQVLRAGKSSGNGGTSGQQHRQMLCCGQVGHRRLDCPRRNECSSQVCRSSGGNA